ncbi:DUF4292 domain-containing protein [Algoriphagus aestuariicola]|uniref:DUF4292 domain-containing protein n=1 Tax=Algoriphagus aestuariicola TaxID=1852016 RepID=A0ABS3BJ94_9BACT|nr:DUF4292 domain-containing protein [Algoriphagus aestuariicola]MBN7799331.1 DUF4292 domain-containing protein [Algoriphagus aestuariicola]
MNRLFAGVLTLLVIGLAGCAKKVVLYESDGQMEEFQPVKAQYDYLSAKAKIVIEEESGKITRGSLSLRAKKDSVLWFTMSPGMGMEAIRGFFTQDRIQIRDRVGQDDIDLSYAEFEKFYGLKLSLELFQNVLWANIPFEFDYEDRLVRVGKKFELTQVKDNVRYFSKIETSHGKVSELVSNSLDDRGSVLASFPKFQDVASQPFPAEVLFKLAYQLPEGSQNTIIHIEWTSIDPNSQALSFPFRF